MASCLTEIACASPEETMALGERLARGLGRESVVALYGGLGSGKTRFVKGFARGLGVAENVASPTYAVVCEYDAGLDGRTFPLYHVDAYRLNGDDDFEAVGAREFMGSGGVTIVEWSERVPGSIPADAVTVEIEVTGPESRLFRVRAPEALTRALGGGATG